jgi:Cu2+-exporting ATPase
MDVPISLAIILAGALSLYEALAGGEHAYFDAALSLTFFLLIGRYLDYQTRKGARSAARELTALEVHTARRITGARVDEVRVSDVVVGDTLLVPTGGRVPVDGVLEADEALLDRSFLTGESEAVRLDAGSCVQAGEINLAAPFQLRATAVGEDTSLRRMAALVDMAENGRNSYTSLADRAAQIYAPLVHLLAFAAFLGWIAATGDVHKAISVAIAVLIITCPCALGLAVPAVTTAAVSRLFSEGYLVKHATALERLAEVDHVVFDKTGTLTTPAVVLPSGLGAPERSALLALAQASQHPVSRALVKALQQEEPAILRNIKEFEGQGVQALWQNTQVRLGRGGWLNADFEGLGLQIGDHAAKPIGTPQALREGVPEMLAALDLDAEILTGDAAAPAQALASALRLPVTANVRPMEKLERLAELAATGRKVLMVGDGLNDTAALAAAHASVSPASALDVARSASDVVILRTGFENIPLLLRVSRMCRTLSQQNFAIAAVYNCIAVPIALAGYATPLAAALAMSLSSITVLINAGRMRYVK